MGKKPNIQPRRPQAREPIDPAKVEDFLTAKGETERSTAPKLQAVPEPAPEPAPVKIEASSEGQKGKRSTVKTRSRDGRSVRQTTVYLEVELAKQLRHHCVDLDVDQSHIINDVLKDYLSSVRP